jgi:glycosyltransferase involved in cell wall biosynthesis
MKITIIIPVYNAAEHIESCFTSLLEQTLTDIEYIFVNDCSSDASLLVLTQKRALYPNRKDNIVILNHDINKGVAAGNTGLEHATGEYIAFVDADDWIEKDMMEKMHRKASDESADIVGCHWYLSFPKGGERKMLQPMPQTTEECIGSMLDGKMKWNLWIFMAKKSLYRDNGIQFIPGLNIGEDMMVVVKLMGVAKKITFVDEALYHYVKINGNSLTQQMPESHIPEIEGNLREVELFLKSLYGRVFNLQIQFLKLNLKLPLLISSSTKSYLRWLHWFSESNQYIGQNKNCSPRTKLVQKAALHRQFWFVRLYYYLVIKVVYGIIYR